MKITFTSNPVSTISISIDLYNVHGRSYIESDGLCPFVPIDVVPEILVIKE